MPMPMVGIADVLVAIAFGVTVFGEPLFSTPFTRFVEMLGLTAMAVGVRQLARRSERPDDSPTLQAAGVVDAT